MGMGMGMGIICGQFFFVFSALFVPKNKNRVNDIENAVLQRGRRDSNPQPSDRQTVAQDSQVIENKKVTRNAELGLPPDLPRTLNEWPKLVLIIER